MTKSFYLVIFGVALFTACAHSSDFNDKGAAINWKKDTNGCFGLRTDTLAKKLVKDYHLMSSSKNNFFQFFGSPNLVKHNDGSDVLIYYFSNACDAGGKPMAAADKCYANFYFKGGSLIKLDFTCE